MASIFYRLLKNRTKSWGYSISNHPFKNIRKSGFKTKKEALAEANFIEKRLSIEKKIRRKSNHKYALLPFYLEFKNWVDNSKVHLDPSTLNDYYAIIKRLNSHFHELPLKDITKKDYQDFLNNMLLAASTTKKLHKKIRAFMKYALKINLTHIDFTHDIQINENAPASPVLPKLLKRNELQLLLTYLEHDSSGLQLFQRTMLYVATVTEVRYGELCGICWNDINYEKKLLYINKQWDYLHGSGFKGLKDPQRHSKKSDDIKERAIPLNDYCLNLFKELQTCKTDTRVFHKFNVKSGTVSNNTFNTWLKDVCSTLNIPKITAHGLRHSYANFLIANKANRNLLQYLMGHSDYSTTNSYYIHFHEEMFEEQLVSPF